MDREGRPAYGGYYVAPIGAASSIAMWNLSFFWFITGFQDANSRRCELDDRELHLTKAFVSHFQC